ncbi:segregation and condensation protein A [Liquorilactobacillus ghanensis]|jgi:segregation and condensation protein A|uniref:segregation and condensation protein A n=1 Tax=Liquorilactobacillus ghanensis TaxID=399370 RepID=UPI0039E80172
MVLADRKSKQLTFKLAAFEGPLDLLLHLIKQNEMDIYDIQISAITSQYLAYLHQMQSLSLDVAGEYLVMAATLLSIKSRLLLPQHEELESPDEPEEDPRQELVEQLLAHQCYQLTANKLQELAAKRQRSYSRPPAEVPLASQKLLLKKQLKITDLERYFEQVLLRQRQRLQLKRVRHVRPEKFTIETEIKRLKKKVSQHVGWLAFDKLFAPDDLILEQVVTSFLALLELIKRGQIEVQQETDLGPIKLRGV